MELESKSEIALVPLISDYGRLKVCEDWEAKQQETFDRAKGDRAKVDEWRKAGWQQDFVFVEGYLRGRSDSAKVGMLCGSFSGNLEVIEVNDAASWGSVDSYLLDESVSSDLPDESIFDRVVAVPKPQGGGFLIYHCEREISEAVFSPSVRIGVFS